MKRFWLLAIISSQCVAGNVSTNYYVHLEPQWVNLDPKSEHEKQFGGKWVLVGSITFRKKSREDIKLEHLALKWHGEQLDNLSGSLYKKLPEKDFIPIEDNVLSDSTWNKADQMLVFDFKQRRQTLGPLNIFYLVLTIPESVHNKLQHGHFSLTHTHLPEPYQEFARSNPLNLALSAQKSALT